MNIACDIKVSVRARLAKDTREIHEALHSNAVLSRLTAPTVTKSEYFAALAVFATVYARIEQERQRLQVYSEFSLEREIAALAKDIGTQMAAPATAHFEDVPGILGGLYVMHGAAFGRTQFARNIAAAKAELPMHFVNLRAQKQVWQALCAQIERTGCEEAAYRQIVKGARAAFSSVAQVAFDATA